MVLVAANLHENRVRGDIVRKLDNKGNVAIILCLVLTVLLGFTAYVVDIGLVYAEKVKLI